MKKKKLLLLVTAITMGLLTACGSSEESVNNTESDVLKVAMELAYPPFETKDNDGNPTGISVDIAEAFGEYIGKEVEIINTSWDGLIPSLQTDKADMVISSMTITEARKEEVDFSDPYAKSLLAVLTNNVSDTAIESIEDLDVEGKTIAVKTGSTGFFYAQENFKNAEVISLADESACVAEVVSSNADAFIYDQLTIYRNWQNNLTSTNALFIPFQDVENWGVAFKKGNDELVNSMNDFLQEYRAEAGFVKLTEKYLAEEKASFDELGFEWFF